VTATATPVHVVGLGLSPADLSPAARALIDAAQVLVGGRRLLGYFPDHPAEKIVLARHPEQTLQDVKVRAAGRRVVILASGDPGFFGIGPLAVQVFGAPRVVLHPNLTAVQAAAARLGLPWHDAALVSLHGRNWEALAAVLARSRTIFVYTDPEHTPAAIARFLRERGLADARLAVLEDLGQAAERVAWYAPAEAVTATFSPLNTVVITREAGPGRSPLHLGLPEEAVDHERGLITKAEVRAVALAKLRLLPGHILWDVGAGSGSVGLEAGLLLPGGTVYAIEKEPDRVARLEANRAKFGAAHLVVVCGRAPHCLAGLPEPQRVFIGGGGEDFDAILTAALDRLAPDGRLVVSAALLATVETARRVLAASGWHCEIVQLQVSRSQTLGADCYLKALNPVWIISGWQN
jgi:precorrin-6Y C5,15-methyltransferase (decarboxylating)